MLGKGLNALAKICILLAIAAVLLQNGCAWSVLTAYVIWKFVKKPIPHFTVILFSGTLIFFLVIIYTLHPPIVSDFQLLYQAAQNILEHDDAYMMGAYFKIWAYQTPFVLWEAFWLFLWNSPIFLKLVNAILVSGIICLLYRLSREWANETAAQTASLLLVVFPFFSTYHVILSNQIPAAFFMTLAVWLLVCSDCRRLGFFRFPLAGLALQMGNLLRSEGIIIVVAILAWVVFYLLKYPKELRRFGAGMIALFIVYFSIHAGADTAVHALGYNPYGIGNGNPLWKIVTGICPESRGSYSGGDWNRIVPTLNEKQEATSATEELEKKIIQNRLLQMKQQPFLLYQLLRNKIKLLWITDALYWAFAQFALYHPFSYIFIRQFDRGIFLIALGLFCYGGFGKTVWERREPAAKFPYFIFFAAFCAFLIVEVQPRYAYLPQLYLFVGAAFGIEKLQEKQKSKQLNTA